MILVISVGKQLKSHNTVFHLNGLLVTRQTDNASIGGAPGGKLVPGSHKRCDLEHTVNRHFSRGDQRIREVIPVPGREHLNTCDEVEKGLFSHFRENFEKCIEYIGKILVHSR